MKLLSIISLSFLIILFACTPEKQSQKLDGTKYIKALTPEDRLFVNYTVINKDDRKIKEIISTWQSYLQSGSYFNSDNKYWISDNYEKPQSFLDQLSFVHLQNTILGVIEVKSNVWELTSMFSSIENNRVSPMWIVKVYAKNTNDGYKLFNKIDFTRDSLSYRKAKEINYYFDDNHVFSEKKADKLTKFNSGVAKLFDSTVISFDYYISKTSKESAELRGFDFSPGMYVPNQYGALADVQNNIIYAGNGSEYYPHEVVHLYTAKEFGNAYHVWFDEGLAALLGGSRGYSIEYHIDKLNDYFYSNNYIKVNDIKTLQFSIPNGKFTTGFRYVIGAIIVDEIYSIYGMKGLREIFTAGSSDSDFYNVIEKLLEVKKENFGQYVRDLTNRKMDECLSLTI